MILFEIEKLSVLYKFNLIFSYFKSFNISSFSFPKKFDISIIRLFFLIWYEKEGENLIVKYLLKLSEKIESEQSFKQFGNSIWLSLSLFSLLLKGYPHDIKYILLKILKNNSIKLYIILLFKKILKILLLNSICFISL